jgi:hypothetical protein
LLPLFPTHDLLFSHRVGLTYRAEPFAALCCQSVQMSQAVLQDRPSFDQFRVQIFWGTETVEVELKRFNDRALNRDLERVCAKVVQEQPCLPDGRRLLFRVQGAEILRQDAQEQAVA